MKEKLNLKELNVQSFLTSLNHEQTKGGATVRTCTGFTTGAPVCLISCGATICGGEDSIGYCPI